MNTTRVVQRQKEEKREDKSLNVKFELLEIKVETVGIDF
jgi:hypothetical protein